VIGWLLVLKGVGWWWSWAVQIAKAEKLKPMEVELKKLEDLSESIVNDFAYMRAREEEMRDTNGELHQQQASKDEDTVKCKH